MTPEELDAARNLIDAVHEDAQRIVLCEGQVRWIAALADETGSPARIVLETALRPEWRINLNDAAIDRGLDIRIAERRVAEVASPEAWLAWAYDQSRLYMSAVDDAAGGGKTGRIYVDVATTELWIAELFEGFVRNDRGPSGAFRTQDQMLNEADDLRAALSRWEADDDVLPARQNLAWAEKILASPLGDPEAAKADLMKRWREI